MSAEKMRKSFLKWLAYFILSSVIAHSFIAYFTGATHLLEMLHGSPKENWTYFLLVSGATAVLLFNFGWFREQFCTIMCPYGRFQSVLMDDRSLTVLYDEQRGEPRKGTNRDALNRGDCVSCNRCVEVCPAGIDIRKGVQMECIGCTACIDACNQIMRRVNKPEHLIRYASVKESRFRIWRPRTIAYITILLVCGGALAFSFASHTPYSATLLRAKDTPYQILPGDMVLNHMKAHLFNQSQGELEVSVVLSPEEEKRGVKLTQVRESNSLRPGESVESHFFITFPKSILNGQGESRLRFLVKESHAHSLEEKESTVVGPR